MVRVRKLSLSEWFTDYQLFYASKSLTHLPGTIDVDVTKLVAESSGHRFSLTAVLVKAVALLLRDNSTECFFTRFLVSASQSLTKFG